MTRVEKNARALATDHLMADLGRRTARGSVVAILAQAIRLALQLASLAIMARLLAPEDFGVVAMATTATAFVGLFTDLGLSAATVQRNEIDQNTVSALFFMNLAIGVVVMALGCAAAPLTSWFFDDGRVAWVVVALAGIIPLAAAGAQHRALLTRGMRWITIQWTALAAQAFGLVVGAFLAWTTGLGYWALVASAWASAILGLALLWTVSHWRPTRVEDWRSAREALNFGLNLTAFNLVNYFHRQLDNALIGRYWGPTELGWYSRAYALLQLPIGSINGPVGSAVVPALSRLQEDPVRWNRTYLSSMILVTFATAVVTGICILSADELIYLLLGPDWTDVATIFRFMCLSMIAQPIMSSTGWLWISSGQVDRMLHWALLAVPLLALSFVVGLPFGPPGVALSYSMTFVALTPLCTLFAAKTLPMDFRKMYLSLSWPIGAALGALTLSLHLTAPSTTMEHPTFPSAISTLAHNSFVYCLLFGLTTVATAPLYPAARCIVHKWVRELCGVRAT